MNSEELGKHYGRYRHVLLAGAAKILGDKDWAEDVLQSTFESLLAGPYAAYEPEKSAPLTWLTNIVNRRCLNALRDQVVIDARRTTSGYGNNEAPDSLLESVEGALRREKRLECLNELLERDLETSTSVRRAILLHHIEGMDLETVAREVGMSRRTLTRRMREALDSWRGRLEDETG